MKKVIVLLLAIMVFSCKEKATPTTKSDEIKVVTTQNFDWLIGNWERTNEKEDRQTYENWNKKSNIEYIGIGFTMQGNDTISKEDIQLVKANSETSEWNLIVSVIGKGEDTSATTFKMIKKDSVSFTCENKEIDFPNTIHYTKDGNRIKALVSGGDMKIPFEFERLKK